jgi:hypothetical protein
MENGEKTKISTFSVGRAVLKPPQSRRWRDCRASPNLAKRLDCGAFTAALRTDSKSQLVSFYSIFFNASRSQRVYFSISWS